MKMIFGNSLVLTSVAFIVCASSVWAGEPEQSRAGFWCPRGIGAAEGNAPGVVMVVEPKKRALIVCGRMKGREGPKTAMSEFDVWDVQSRPIPKLPKESGPITAEDAHKALRERLAKLTEETQAGRYRSDLDGSGEKHLLLASSLDDYSIKVAPSEVSFDRIFELPRKEGSLVWTPIRRETLNCKVDEACERSEPSCLLPRDLKVLSEDQVALYAKEIKNSILFLAPSNGLRMRELLASALMGSQGARSLLSSLQRDPRSDGSIGEEIRRSNEILGEADSAGCSRANP